MKTKIVIIIFFAFLQGTSFSQAIDNPNYISGKIKVPVIVNQIFITDHLLDDKRDSKKKNENVSLDIYTQLKNIPIYFLENGFFKGASIEELNNVVTVIKISGSINPKTNLGVINIHQIETKNTKSGVCDYEYEYSYNYEYKDLRVNTILPIGNKQKNKSTSYFFKSDKDTKLTVHNYKYFEDTSCPKRNYSKEYMYKSINKEYLIEKLSSHWSYFSFNINWNGKLMKDILQENKTISVIRGEDPNWEPLYSIKFNKNTETEPNSIGVYSNLENLDKNSIISTNGIVALLIADLAKISGLKVLERANIDKIIQEINLSDSGLVTEESKVKNKLLKEQMSVIIKIDEKNNKSECRIVSKNKEVLITYQNYDFQKFFPIKQNYLTLIIKEIKEQFDISTTKN